MIRDDASGINGIVHCLLLIVPAVIASKQWWQWMWQDTDHGSYIVNLLSSDTSLQAQGWWWESLLLAGVELLSTLAIGLVVGLSIQWLLLKLLMYFRGRPTS